MSVFRSISGDRLLFVNVSKYWIARLYGDLSWWGGVYLIFGLLAVGLSFLVEGGNLFFLFVQSSPDKLPSPDLGGMFIALGLIFIVYIPFAMATWFAAPLIGWKKMGFGKALFYSFFTVVRETYYCITSHESWSLKHLIPRIILGVIGFIILIGSLFI